MRKIFNKLEKFSSGKLFGPKLLIAPVIVVVFLGIFFSYFYNQKDSEDKNSITSSEQINESPAGGQDVLGHRTPQIHISGGRSGYRGGGVIALSSADEPFVTISGYDISGKAEVSVYEAGEQAVLDYLTHDQEGMQTKKDIDPGKFRFIKKIDHEIVSDRGEGSRLLLPISQSGIFFLRIKQGSIHEDSFVIRSGIGAIVKEGDNEYIFWGQNFKNGRSLTEGSLSLYNLQDNLKEVSTGIFDSDGIARTNLIPDADIALVRYAGEKALIPINLQYLNSSYQYQPFQRKEIDTKFFIFTDRPLYKPGDTVYFKSVLRDDDDARYTIPTGQALVKIYDGYGEEDLLLEKSFQISGDGTVNGEYVLPVNAKTGSYRLTVGLPDRSEDQASFDVEFFRKPEFSIEVKVPETEFISGDDSSFTVTGSYFSGQPLSGQKIRYTVYSASFYEYSYLTDRSYILNDNYRYNYWGGGIVTSGEAELGKDGAVKIDFSAKLPEDIETTQVFSIEATVDDGSANPSFSRKNVLVYAGEYGIFRRDAESYRVKVNSQLSLPVSLVSHRDTDVAGIDLTASITRENWIQYQEEGKKYPSYRKEEETLPAIQATTDSQGNVVFNLTPTKVGSYHLTVEGKDNRNNTISKTFFSYVTSDDYPYYFGETDNELSIIADKPKYQPTDTVRFTITSTVPDRDIFLSMERGRANRYEIVKMSGNNATVDVPLVDTDVPNIYAKVSSFSDHAYDFDTENVIVSPENKALVVSVTPDRTTFGPGEDVVVNIETKDTGGNPVSADLALWAVDKAIFELVDQKPEKIFDAFWQERYNDTQESHSLRGVLVQNAEMGGGCFAEGTEILMNDGSSLPIEKVNVGDFIKTRESDKSTKLVSARVLGRHEKTVSGYMIINGSLKVTNNHKLWVNNSWKEAGLVQVGDVFSDSEGNDVYVSSVEWARGKFTVYNLSIEKYNTFFADNLFVHNQKGPSRTTFEDTAYWNPTVKTDNAGRAQVSFKLPDNLTTWVLAAVGSTVDTKAGQVTSEIVVTKDIIVRPILPNILRSGDEIVLSALVQNSTETDQTVDIDLDFDSGDIKSATHSGVLVKANEIKQVYWDVRPKTENEKSKLSFSAWSRTDDRLSDTIVQEIPVQEFGFLEQRAETGDGPKTFNINLAKDIHREKSTVTISLAPTILGTLSTSMNYLVNYPYGCVEQTTSRFVPAVIAKSNPDLFPNILEDKDVDDIIQKGLDRLAAHQKSDGGWTWWYSGESDPFVTAYVVEYIFQARESGADVDEEILEKAERYLERLGQSENESQDMTIAEKENLIARNYALTVLGVNDKVKEVDNLSNLSPDLLSLAVITNYLNGDSDPQTNGLAMLISSAKPQGDSVFWDGGRKANFASIDASTALAIRAILTAGGDREIAVRGARYLTRNRKFNYWSNTFATAQIVRSMVELSKTGSESTPTYDYSVLLDGDLIAGGGVSDVNQSIDDIKIPIDSISPNGSSIAVSKTGEGQMYSTLVIDEFHTDRRASALDHGLAVTREYISDKGENYSLAVGDAVTVKITVSGLDAGEYYGIVVDELPSGLVPINQDFKNEQYGRNSDSDYQYDSISDREVTQNGMIISVYRMGSGENVYTYKARVVSEGKFIVPPARASLMYAPEIYGRSDVQTVETTKESKIIPGKFAKEAALKIADSSTPGNIVLVVLIIVGVAYFILRKHGIALVHVRDKIAKVLKRKGDISRVKNKNDEEESA